MHEEHFELTGIVSYEKFKVVTIGIGLTLSHRITFSPLMHNSEANFNFMKFVICTICNLHSPHFSPLVPRKPRVGKVFHVG